jgi:hypothetical protein
MKLINLLVCLFFFMNEAEGQKEYEIKQYDKDPLAEAVVISDEGKSSFQLTDYEDFEIIFERMTTIKIFTKAGLKWSEFSIPFYKEGGKSEFITDLVGITYNQVNGIFVKTELQPKNIYEEKINGNWYSKKFAMPDVKEGSVIFVSYKISSPYRFNFRSWEFQRSIPVIFSRYITKMVPFYEYRYVLQGTDRLDEFKNYVEDGIAGRFGSSYGSIEYKNMDYEFIMRDVPAFKDESYITSINDYIIKLDFQLSVIHHLGGRDEQVVSTWPKLSDELIDNEDFGKYLKNSTRKCKEITEEMNLGSKSTLEKAKAIDRYVKSNFSWDGHSRIFTSKSTKDFLSAKTGNAADLNLLLIGMLNAVGIEANPVILSTRSNGKIKVDYPFAHLFDYVIAQAKIDGVTYLLDATEPFAVFGEIPTRCFNDKGFVVQKNKVEWVTPKSNSNSVSEYQFDLSLNSSTDSLCGKCKLVSTGYDAIGLRKKFVSSYKELKTQLAGTNSPSSDSLKSLNLKDIEKPFEISYDLKSSIDKVEDKIIISPFSNSTMTENPLKQPVRNYPVDMVYKNADKFQSTIKIPSGYKILTKPDNMTIDNKLVKITYSTEVLNDDIKITGYYEFKNDVYVSADYVELKGYFNRIVDKFNEKLVLVKG